MRIFEILIIVSNLLALVSLWLQTSRSRIGSFTITGVLALLLVVHLVWEGSRWQMIPAYLVSGGLIFYLVYSSRREAQLRSRRWELASCVVGVLAQISAAVLAVALPVPRLLPPTGPFAVGTTSYHWIDRSRADQFAPDPRSPRELMVRVWYPAAPNQQITPLPAWPTIDTLGPTIAGEKGAPGFVLSHLRYVQAHALPEALLAPSRQPYPVIVFSHGLGSVPEMNIFLVEELASQGYVVIGINHTYSSATSVFPDGRVARYRSDLLNADMSPDEYSRAAQRLVDVWAADMRFVLDQVEQLNRDDPQALFTSRLDLSRIGGAGYSFGGSTVAQASYLDPRIQAGVMIDSPVWGSVMDHQLQQPFMFINSAPYPSYEQLLGYGMSSERARFIQRQRSSSDSLFQRLVSQGYKVAVNGTRHQNFSEVPLLVPYGWLLGLTGPIDPLLALRITNEYTVAFFDHTLNQRSAPLLEGGTTPYPEVEIESHADQERANQ